MIWTILEALKDPNCWAMTVKNGEIHISPLDVLKSNGSRVIESIKDGRFQRST